VTSVNVRHARNVSGQFQQDGGGFSLGVVPVDGKLRSDWRKRFNGGRGAQLEWMWADPNSFPTSENRQRAETSYAEVRAVIKLGESLLQSGALWAETTNLAQTQQIMRGQGEMVECEVVGIAGGRLGGALSRVRARRALIVAVEKYESAALAGLANVDNDANLLECTLQKLGWGVEVVQNAGLDDAEEAIGRFAESVAGSGDACLFAFIGHGAEVSGSVFLVPSDAKLRGEYRETSDLEKDVSRKCIRFADVQAAFARHRGGAPADAEATVFVLDCCRDGMSCAVTGAGRGIGLQKAGAGAAARAEVKNAFVIFSTSSGRTAGDGRAGEGGPFMNVFTYERVHVGVGEGGAAGDGCDDAHSEADV
jgi:hypothetical protein